MICFLFCEMLSTQTPISSGKVQRWYDENNNLHREDGPAVICTYGSQFWYKHGKQHREDGPAVISTTYEEWWCNGKLHREDGPAFKYHSNIVEKWYLNGKLHREGGPAVIQPGFRAWYRNGLQHREDGPAVENSEQSHYYLFGVMYQKDRFIRLVRLIKRFNNNLKKKYRERVRLAIYTNTKMCQDLSDLISQYCL